jgi:hypothetical protein
MRPGVIGASLILSSNLFSIAASAEALVWGSGRWGDIWLGVNSVPALSPPALGLLAVALAVSVILALGRRSRSAPER